jgi:hypothetical protein
MVQVNEVGLGSRFVVSAGDRIQGCGVLRDCRYLLVA